MNPKVAIVTLNWNGLEHLKYFLPSAEKQTYDNYSIIVVDNGSDDSSIEFVKQYHPNVIIKSLKENLGYSKGFNSGINEAISLESDYILITSNDVKLDKHIVEEGIKLFRQSEKIGYMSGKIFNLGQKNILQYAGGRDSISRRVGPNRGQGEQDEGQYESVEDFEFMDDVCGLVSTQMVRDVGAYDDDFFFDFEETEWNVRIRNKGYRIVYNPKMVAWHRIHGSTGGNRNSFLPEYYHWRGKLLFNYKTLSSSDFFIYCLRLSLIYVPTHWIILIKNGNSFLIYPNILGILSGFKRVIELKSK